MTISLGNTHASGGEDETLLTTSATRTAEALDAIPVEPVKRTGDDADKFAEPITTTAPKRDNLGTASLTAIEGETALPIHLPPIAHGPPQNFVLFSQDNVMFDSTPPFSTGSCGKCSVCSICH